LSFKFIAIAYGMLGATAATGYMVQGGGNNGAAGKRPTTGHVAEAPKVERVAKLEMPPKPGSMPQVAMVATSPQDDSVVMTAPAATPSGMLLTAPPTPAPPPAESPSRMAARAEKPAESPVEKIAEKPPEKPPEKLVEKTPEKPVDKPIDRGSGRSYLQITADMMVNPWTGAWLTSDDRSMGYISGPATGTAPAAAPAPVMVADAQPAAPEAAVAAASMQHLPPEPVTAPVTIPVTLPAPTTKRTAPPPAIRKAEGQKAEGHQHGYMAHLASYRDEIHAAAGWKTLQKSHRDLLINRTPVTMTAEIPGQGTFVRLMADGFSQLADVSEFCSEFKASGQYCIPVKAK
jgi:hypothetical protein